MTNYRKNAIKDLEDNKLVTASDLAADMFVTANAVEELMPEAPIPGNPDFDAKMAKIEREKVVAMYTLAAHVLQLCSKLGRVEHLLLAQAKDDIGLN